MIRKFALFIITLILIAVGCQAQDQQKEKKESQNKEIAVKIEIKSTAFEEGATIPRKYTCDDIDVSPALSWSNPPEGTKSWALICDDPDAPMGTWVHWVLYNLPSETTSLPEAVPKDGEVLDGADQGKNDFGRIGYGGPCPPPGKPHRYYFKIYALDNISNWEPGLSKAEVMVGIEGHVLAEGQLMGKYGR